MKNAARIFAAVIVASLALARAAHADDPKRAKPDYDGRGDPPTTAGDVALWVPRLVLLPPYLLTEYGIRRPLGALISTAERKKIPQILINFFTFGKNRKSVIVPTAFFDFGAQPSVGVYMFLGNVAADDNDVIAHVSYFGSDWIAGSATDRLHVGKTSTISLTLGGIRRPDYVYAGIGARTLESNRSRYLGNTLSADGSFDLHVARGVSFHSKIGVKSVSFQDSNFWGDPSVSQSVAAGTFAAPDAFATGYTEGYERAELVLDTRPHRPESQTGVRLLANVEHGTDVRASPATSWLKYGGSAGAFWDINGRARVIGATVTTEFADPLQGTIPFSELVSWGGTGALSGFLPRRLHGRSGAAASLNYEWPIWVWLDGTLHAAVGNVFDAGLKDFDPKLLRFSSGIGVRSNSSPDHQFEILLGFASETFDQGGKIDSFRLVFGGTNGF